MTSTDDTVIGPDPEHWAFDRIGTEDDHWAVLAAMADVARVGRRGLTPTDRHLIEDAARIILPVTGSVDVDELPASSPAGLAGQLASPRIRRQAYRILVVAAYDEVQLDEARFERAATYAEALGIPEQEATLLRSIAHDHLRSATLHAVQGTFRSAGATTHWIKGFIETAGPLVFGVGGVDDKEAARFRALADLPESTFGRRFHDHYVSNGFAFPGEKHSLGFYGVRHDSCHVVSGYDTSGQGELLVAAFTAAMRAAHNESFPEADPLDYVTMVMFQNQLGVKVTPFDADHWALDPAKYWTAWARGGEIAVDLASDDFDFWVWAERDLEDLRRELAVPPLDPAMAPEADPGPLPDDTDNRPTD